MSEQVAPSSEEAVTKIVIPSGLALSQAADVHAAALVVLDNMKDGIEVDIEGDEDLSVCALQMLIATKRSADAEALEINFSDKANTVLEAIDMT